MDVRRPTRIRNRFDRQELIPAARIGDRSPVSLEILVARLIDTAIPDIVVAAMRVALPNLNPCSGNRLSVGVEDAPDDPRDAALSGPLVAGDVDQIVVGILRKAPRIKRAGSLPWGWLQRAGGTRRQSEQRGRSRERESAGYQPASGQP